MINQKPSILVIIERFYPLVGGAETQCLQLFSKLKIKGFPISVVTKKWRREFPKSELVGEEKLSVSRIGIEGFSHFADYFSGISLIFYLISQRNKYQIFFVDSGLANIFASTAILMGKLLSKKVVVKMETPGELFFSGPQSLSPKKFVHPLIRLRVKIALSADFYIAQTEGMKMELMSLGVKESQIRCFPNNVDENLFFPLKTQKEKNLLKKRLGLPLDKVLVFFCGRLVVRKGLIFLLDAWCSLSKLAGSSLLVFIGSGKNQPDSVEDDLKKIISEKKLEENTLFLGEKTKTEVADYLKIADVFVYPSIHPEGRALSVLEALSAEIPVIVTNIGGLREIVTDGKNGLIVAKNDTNKLTLLLLSLISDKKLRNTLGRNGREEVIEKYSLNKSANDNDEFFSSIIKTI